MFGSIVAASVDVVRVRPIMVAVLYFFITLLLFFLTKNAVPYIQMRRKNCLPLMLNRYIYIYVKFLWGGVGITKKENKKAASVFSKS